MQVCGKVMVFSATYNNISIISCRKPKYLEKTTDLPQVTDKLYHIILYRVHLAISWLKTHNVFCFKRFGHRAFIIDKSMQKSHASIDKLKNLAKVMTSYNFVHIHIEHFMNDGRL